MARRLVRRALPAVLSLLCLMGVLCLAFGGKVPFPERYFLWLRGAAQGDLGFSTRYSAPVLSILAQRIGPSLLLMGTGVSLAVLTALPLGVLAACQPHSLWDHLSGVLALAGAAVPRFFLGIVCIYAFSFRLRWFPAMGMYAINGAGLGDVLRHLILPSLILAMGSMGRILEQTRNACLDVLHEDYIRAARARGLSEAAVLVRHVLRTALAPICARLLLELPSILSSAAVTEKIFGWPGLGALAIDALRNRDVPLILGASVTMAGAVLAADLLSDVVRRVLDPRLSQEGAL